MKAFEISKSQLSSIIGAAIADELSLGFNRHFDFLTRSSWTGETMLGPDGIALQDDEVAACAERLQDFFGIKGRIDFSSKHTIDQWAELLYPLILKKCTQFSFKSAARQPHQSLFIHDADQMYQDSAAAANLLYGRRRLLSLVAPHSLFGFSLSILMPNLLNIEAVDCRQMSPEHLADFSKFGDVILATPSLWRYMMQQNLSAPDNSIAVSFGEPMSPQLAANMRKSGFGVLREFYGSTESGLIGWRDDPSESFLLFDHWRQQDQALVRKMPNGRLVSVDVMDQIEWTDDRRFNLLGRRDGAVQVGAVNVFPEDIAAVLKEHPRIETCQISHSYNSDGVARLVAHIVLNKGSQPNEGVAKEIDVWCRGHLRQQERPRIYRFERIKK